MFNANGFLNEILDCLVLDMPPPLHLGRPWTYDVDDDDDNDNEEALHTPRKTTASCRASNRFGWENIIIDRRGFRYQIGVGRRTMTMRRGDGWLWLRSCMAAACTCMVSVDGGDLLFRRERRIFLFWRESHQQQAPPSASASSPASSISILSASAHHHHHQIIICRYDDSRISISIIVKDTD